MIAVTCLDKEMVKQRSTITGIPVGGHNVIHAPSMKLGLRFLLLKELNALSQVTLVLVPEEIKHGTMVLQLN